MSLSQKIAAAVADNLGTFAPPLAIAAEHGRFQLNLAVGAATPVGLETPGFRFAPTEAEDRSLASLQAWGERIAARVTYLTAPLAVLEVDPLGHEVLLRSQKPTLRGTRRLFDEVRLTRSGVLTFGRVVFDETTRRRSPASCPLTCETLERLIDDLVTTAE